MAAVDAGLPPKTSLADRSLPSSLEISNGDLNHKMALKVEGAEAGYGQNKENEKCQKVDDLEFRRNFKCFFSSWVALCPFHFREQSTAGMKIQILISGSLRSFHECPSWLALRSSGPKWVWENHPARLHSCQVKHFLAFFGIFCNFSANLFFLLPFWKTEIVEHPF